MDQLHQQQQQQEQTILRSIAISSSQPVSSSSSAAPSQQDRQAAYQILQDLKAYPGRISICLNWLQSENPIQVVLNKNNNNNDLLSSSSSHSQITGAPVPGPAAAAAVVDITVATKLLALEILQAFLQKGYSQSSEQDRIALRQGVLNSCRLLAWQATTALQQQQGNMNDNNIGSNDFLSPGGAGTRILASKLASLLEGLVVRDFPQRWTTLATDLFSPLITSNSALLLPSHPSPFQHNDNSGGLWEELPPLIVDSSSGSGGGGGVALVGVKICLECFRLVAEDCTDSDFNAKISTTRRNDVLLGLNELADTVFLPRFYQILERAYPALQKSKTSLHNMNLYLLSQNRTTNQMTREEAMQYRIEERTITNLSRLVFDTLRTLEIFCANLPSTWILGGGGGGSSNENGNQMRVSHKLDFVAAMLHLMRVPDANVNVKAVECIEQLCIRGKLELNDWMRLITDIPGAFQEANQILTSVEHEYRKTLTKVNGGIDTDSTGGSGNSSNENEDLLTVQLDFHKALSRMLSVVVSSHIAHITSDSNILAGKGGNYTKLNNFFTLLVGMLRHPSGRILSEQINMWTTLFRDPQITKSRHSLLQPFAEEILVCCMDQMTKIRWEDVENEIHPHSSLMEASFDDEDDYDEWMNDFRSRSSLLFKFIGNTEPAITSNVLSNRLQSLVAKYGNGEPSDHLNSSNKQLTLKSEAVIQFEAFCQPLDNTLGGIPSWAMVGTESTPPKPQHQYGSDENDRRRAEIRAATHASLSTLGNILVQWKPSYVWLKFRHITLLEAMKHFWDHDPSTLLQGVDTMIRYLGLGDEWKANAPSFGMTDQDRMSGEMVSLKKRSGTALVSVSKRVPHHLVPWLSQLSAATRSLLSSDAGLIPLNQMHLYEFLSCVATAVSNPQDRSNFIADVLSDAVTALESPEIQECFSSATALFSAFGILQAADHPESVTDTENVRRVTSLYNRMFTALNRLLSVGRRCNEAARKKSILGGISTESLPLNIVDFGQPGQPVFPPDEGPLSISDLAINDPFAPLWPRILPSVLQMYETILSAWRPEHQASLMQNRIQRYAFAISDDEAYLSKTQNVKGSGGVFGEGGTAGSVVSGTDRRDMNLVPKWSGWLNELRNTGFQMLGLLIAQRVMFAPEIAHLYPRLVSVLVDPWNLKSMEHRHITQFLKHVLEFLLICCPASLYKTHMEPIVGPIFEHMRYRLEKTWAPVIGQASSVDNSTALATKALGSADCANIGIIVSRGEEVWFSWYYAHAGLFVGDLDAVTSEAAVEKYRIEISRTFSDVLQSGLALKGEWALVLANVAREDQAAKRSDASKLTSLPRTLINTEDVVVNADGSPKQPYQTAVDARKLLRINGLSHFLLLESEGTAGNLTLAMIQCLGYPDAYTCRRVTKICHRILEAAAWYPKYSQLLGHQMFLQAVKNLVTEPKWMVGMEWDMISVVRDIYCRLVLGQTLSGNGQGLAQQQPTLGEGSNRYEQAKTVNQPLQGGGVLEVASDLPRHILASLPGIGLSSLEQFESQMKTKRSAKDQKDIIRDLLRIASDNLNEMNPSSSSSLGSAAASIFDRALEEESLLHSARRQAQVQDLPEKLVTRTQLSKAAASSQQQQDQPGGLVAFSL